MLERSGLSTNDKKLVMTGVNLDKTDSVIFDMTNSMKKYFGDGINNRERKTDISIKEEPVYNTRTLSDSSESLL